MKTETDRQTDWQMVAICKVVSYTKGCIINHPLCIFQTTCFTWNYNE